MLLQRHGTPSISSALCVDAIRCSKPKYLYLGGFWIQALFHVSPGLLVAIQTVVGLQKSLIQKGMALVLLGSRSGTRQSISRAADTVRLQKNKACFGFAGSTKPSALVQYI